MSAQYKALVVGGLLSTALLGLLGTQIHTSNARAERYQNGINILRNVQARIEHDRGLETLYLSVSCKDEYLTQMQRALNEWKAAKDHNPPIASNTDPSADEVRNLEFAIESCKKHDLSAKAMPDLLKR